MSTQKELHVTEGESATVSMNPNKSSIFREKMEILRQKEGNALVVGKVIEKPVFNHKKNAEYFYSVSLEVERDNSEKKKTDILDVIVSNYIIEDVCALEGKTVLIFGELRSKYSKEKRLCIYIFAESVDIVDDDFRHQNKIRLVAEVAKDTVKRTTPTKRMDITDIFLKKYAGHGINYYFPSIAWRRNSVFAGRLHKGNIVLITGRLQSRDYVKRVKEEGEREDKRTVHEISIISIELVDSQNKTETNNSVEEKPSEPVNNASVTEEATVENAE